MHVHVAVNLSEKNKYALLTKREVKMAGYWPSSFIVFLWTETNSRSIKTQKKKNEAMQYPTILDRKSLVNKGCIIWPKGYITEVSHSTRR